MITVALIGASGAGKSSVGPLPAAHLGLGGGAPLTPEVTDTLRAGPHVVCLRVTPGAAATRVGVDPRRPLPAIQASPRVGARGRA